MKGKLNRSLLVCRLFPAVIFATAASINGVTSLPFIPAFSASAIASLIELLMTESERKNLYFHDYMAMIFASLISITVHSMIFGHWNTNQHSGL